MDRYFAGEYMGDTMNDEKPEVQKQDEETAQQNFANPYDYLATIPGAPTKDQVEAMKLQAPNGIVRLLVIGKRVYLVRGMSGLELQNIQSQIPDNLGAGLTPEARSAKIEGEIQLHAAAKCTIWTNTIKDGKFTVEQLRGGSAGLPSTLFNLITYMSDFIDPEALNVMSIEL